MHYFKSVFVEHHSKMVGKSEKKYGSVRSENKSLKILDEFFQQLAE